MQPRALLIDAMGTLVRLEDPVGRLRVVLRDRFGVAVSAAQARAALGAEIAFYRERFDAGVDAEAVAALRTRCAEVLWAALPAATELASVPATARTEALLAALRFAAFADAAPALGRVRDAGARVVVVSNWDASLPEVLERVGLADHLDGVVCSARVGARKPAPEIFARALELAGTGARGAVHVGDSLAEDVAGARAAGIEAVWLRRDAAAAIPPDGVRTIRSLDGLGEDAGSVSSTR